MWWPWIRSAKESQHLFFAPGTADLVLSKFAAPDIVAFGCGSLIACGLAVRGSSGAVYASWFALGAAAYACIGAIAVNWPPLTVPLADLLMATTLASGLFCAVRLTRLRHG
jgi:hypothetical protein